MRVPVQMHDIDRCIVREPQQPVSRVGYIPPGVRHPLQAKVRFNELYVRQSLDRRALRIAGARPHGREHDVDVVSSQRLAQVERISPDAAHRIGGHEDSHAR